MRLGWAEWVALYSCTELCSWSTEKLVLKNRPTWHQHSNFLLCQFPKTAHLCWVGDLASFSWVSPNAAPGHTHTAQIPVANTFWSHQKLQDHSRRRCPWAQKLHQMQSSYTDKTQWPNVPFLIQEHGLPTGWLSRKPDLTSLRLAV